MVQVPKLEWSLVQMVPFTAPRFKEGGDGYGGYGCGTVFNLKPPATVCKTALCPWTETVLYRFAGVMTGLIQYTATSFSTKQAISTAPPRKGGGVVTGLPWGLRQGI